MRASARRARFDLRAFHDTVLQPGSVQLPVLQARIDAFIGGGKRPYPHERAGAPNFHPHDGALAYIMLET